MDEKVENAPAVKTILLVEDEAIIALSEAATLRAYGYRVIHAYTGESALWAVENVTEIDLVLMDINLGSGMDGTQTAERILKLRELPVVFLSSHTERDIVEKTEGITSYGYIVKQSGETVLIASLKMAFRLFEARLREKEHKAALQEREERFANLFRNAPLGYQSLDENGNFVEVNQSWLDMLGYAREEVIGHWFGDFLAPEGLNAFRYRFPAFKAQGHVSTEFDIRCKTGDYRRIAFEGRIGRKPDGAFLQTHCILSDITERKRADDMLRLQAMVLDQIKDRITVTDLNGVITYVNHAQCETLQRRREELIGQRVTILGSDSQNGATQQEILDQTLAHGGWRGRVVNITADGTVHLLEVRTGQIFDDQRRPIALVGIGKEITERQQIEDALRLREESYLGLFNTVTEAIYILDADGVFLNVNDGAVKMYGYSREELIGQTPAFVSAPGKNDLAGIFAMLERVFATGERASFEFWGRRKNGEIFPKECIANRGKYLGQDVIITTARDVTERKQAVDAHKKALEEKQALLREVQHRAKNSLAMIGSLIELMATASQSAEARTLLADLRSRVVAMAELYRLLSSSDTISAAPLDSYCARVAASYRLPKNICFVQSYAPMDVPVKTAATLGLIFNELLTNAVKHAFPGGREGAIVITLSQAERCAMLRVCDNGVGLPEDFNLATNHSLGLMLANTLAAQIGGELRVERNGGACFVVDFPLLETNAE